jgi:hypothetical protein
LRTTDTQFPKAIVLGSARSLEHGPKKWNPVSEKIMLKQKSQSGMPIEP